MLNPDPVFFNELDGKIIGELKQLGAEIIEIDFDNIYFKFSDKIEFYFKN